MSGHVEWKTYAALMTTVLFWGLSFVATKVALESIPTFTLVFARFGFASFFFAALLFRKGMPVLTGADHGKVFLMALFEPGLYFVCETMGLLYTSAPKASLIIATVPVAVTIISAVLLRERTDSRGIAGIALSLSGVFLLVTADPSFDGTFAGSLKGDLLIAGAVLSAAFYIVGARELGRRHSAETITALQTFYGALFYAPAFFWQYSSISWTSITLRSWSALFYLTIFATVIAFLSYNYALTKISAPRAAICINGIPVVTALGAWIVLGESLTLVQMLGGVIVLAAVWITNHSPRISVKKC